MIAVRMADEDVLHLAVVELVSEELPLCAFATVNHVEFSQTADNLR